ncbi:hypothetical protein SAMN02745121_04588 [Nannocystis exedens]|uniref:Uncharacterized protein n=1 Tax=Nannocystis exedens TaxID=54 RepID=A0A1I2BBJ7_9BACT|nr:hypothetical protein [Nannocystis exedens]PCC68069.1 hypothetical protein NAEX_01077 [Nannocystis exedens]SFE53544.1 hypothetical protein SAMN02745121_04588 [Nannocystis exedens]
MSSWRVVQDERRDISRTEDLHGVFVHGEGQPVEACEPPAGEESGGSESTSSSDTE